MASWMPAEPFARRRHQPSRPLRSLCFLPPSLSSPFLGLPGADEEASCCVVLQACVQVLLWVSVALARGFAGCSDARKATLLLSLLRAAAAILVGASEVRAHVRHAETSCQAGGLLAA